MSKAVVTFAANNELALHVPDPAAAEVFSVRVLGCKVVSRSPDCVALTSGALRLYLLRDPAPGHDAVVPSFDVPDRAAALTTLQGPDARSCPSGRMRRANTTCEILTAWYLT